MNNIVRAFVLVLAATGSAAYAHMNLSNQSVIPTKNASCPRPTCIPGNNCTLDN